MAEIIVIVAKDGSTSVSVNGVVGSGCRQMSESIEKAIGNETHTDLTSAYYEQVQSDDTRVKQ
jgi:hypothetical protein